MNLIWGMSQDGRAVLVQGNSDGTSVMYVLPEDRLQAGAMVNIPLAECEQGLYGPDGTLLATCNDRYPA